MHLDRGLWFVKSLDTLFCLFGSGEGLLGGRCAERGAEFYLSVVVGKWERVGDDDTSLFLETCEILKGRVGG
jgi:hypothetical protein